MSDVAAELWEMYNTKPIQDGFWYMLDKKCPYRTLTGFWAAEEQVIAVLDFVVQLCDSLKSGNVEERDVSKMFPTIGHALIAFEKSEYFGSDKQDRKLTKRHIAMFGYWKRYIH